MALLVGLFALLMLRHLYQRSSDTAQPLYLRFCRKLARAGTVRAAHEGPQDFAERAPQQHIRSMRAAIHDITARYLACAMKTMPDAEGLRALRRDGSSIQAIIAHCPLT